MRTWTDQSGEIRVTETKHPARPAAPGYRLTVAGVSYGVFGTLDGAANTAATVAPGVASTERDGARYVDLTEIRSGGGTDPANPPSKGTGFSSPQAAQPVTRRTLGATS